ncbi:MAG: TonB-dependent receptor [Gammaproteobacteria bacterium]
MASNHFSMLIPAIGRLRSRITSLLFLVYLGFYLAPSTAGADETTDIGSPGVNAEELYFGELPVVLSATRLSQPVSEAPVAVTIIDRDLIEASGAREVADLFRLVPGFIVGSKDGSQRIVGYHGILDAFNRRMQVLIDGRSVYTPTFGGVLWSDLPLAIEEIDRIEVVRGPNAATYGPNAFQGIISITTRHASEDSGHHVMVRSGSHGIADGYYRYGGTREDFDYRVSLRATSDSGFDNLHDDKLMKALNFRGDYQASSVDNLEFHAQFSEGGQQTEDSAVLREKDVSTYSLQALWRRFVDIGNEFRLQIYHNHFETDDRYTDSVSFGTATISGIVDLDRYGERTDIEFEHLLTITPRLDIVWGSELRRDKVVSSGLFNPSGKHDSNLIRLFGTLDYQVSERTNLSLGVMVEENDISDRSTSPRFAINHELSPGHTVRASVSRATRTPSFFEALGSWVTVGNLTNPSPPPLPGQYALFSYQAEDALEEEKIESLDLGYFFDLPRYNLSGDVRVYREEYRDIIYDSHYPFSLLPDPYFGVPNLNTLLSLDPPSVTNAVNLVLRGMELQAEWRPSNRDRVFLGYSYIDADVDYHRPDIANSIPEEIFSVLWSHNFTGGFRTSIAYYSVDEFEYLGTADGSRLEEQHRLDVKLSQEVKSAKGKGEISFVLQSALDSYQDYLPANIFDTRAYMSLAWEY